MGKHLLVVAVVAYLEGGICLVSEHPYRVGTVRVVAGAACHLPSLSLGVRPSFERMSHIALPWKSHDYMTSAGDIRSIMTGDAHLINRLLQTERVISCVGVMAKHAHTGLNRRMIGPFVLFIQSLVMAVKAHFRYLVINHPAAFTIGTVGVVAEGAHPGGNWIMRHFFAEWGPVMADVAEIGHWRGKKLFVI